MNKEDNEMDDKKVVSIEDRIPKLKEARRKKTNRRLIFYLCLFFVLIAIVVYLQSPLSYVQAVQVTGNQYLTREDIISHAQLTEDVNIWSIRMSDVEARLNELPEVKQAVVKRKLPNKIEIKVEELNKVAYVNQGEAYYPLLENGYLLDSLRIVDYQGDAPLLFGFSDEEYLMLLVDQLVELPKSITSHISEIYWDPSESNPFTLRLFMNDGFEVIASIRHFSDHMSSYPSIISQLDGEGGVIEIGAGGAIFYTNDHEDQSEGAEPVDEDEG